MKVGYARVSSTGQSLEVQLEALKGVGCEKVYKEKKSGKTANDRPELQKAIEFVREGDTLIVSKLDRLARSVPDLHTIAQGLSAKGVGLVVLDHPGATRTLQFLKARISWMSVHPPSARPAGTTCWAKCRIIPQPHGR